VPQASLIAPLAHLVTKPPCGEWSFELGHQEREITYRSRIDDPLQFGVNGNFEPNRIALLVLLLRKNEATILYVLAAQANYVGAALASIEQNSECKPSGCANRMPSLESLKFLVAPPFGLNASLWFSSPSQTCFSPFEPLIAS